MANHGPTAVAEDSDVIGVPAERLDILLDPLQSEDDVPQALIARCHLVSEIQKSCAYKKRHLSQKSILYTL